MNGFIHLDVRVCQTDNISTRNIEMTNSVVQNDRSEDLFHDPAPIN